MTGEQTFLVTGFKKVPTKREIERRKTKNEQNPFCSVLRQHNLLRGFTKLENGKKKICGIYLEYCIAFEAPGNVLKVKYKSTVNLC